MRPALRVTLGKRIVVISVLIWIIDRVTNIFSTFIGMLVCGDEYLCPVDGVVCDLSCGFNTDLHLSFTLVLFIILGAVLYILGKRAMQKQASHKN